MSNQELIKKLQEEIEYTKIYDNIEKLYIFLTSEKANELSDYQKILLETQLNAMNVYRNMLVLRLHDFNAREIEEQLKVEAEDEGSSNQ